jgi:subtilisin family serine protease
MFMWMRGLRVVIRNTKRIPSVFTLSLFFCFGLAVTEIVAKSESILTASSADAIRLMKDRLHYPDLPSEIQAKIRNAALAKARETAPDSGMAREWGLASIGFFDVFSRLVEPTRATVQDCSSKVVVAVIDTGIDYTHPELKDNIWVNRGETGYWEPPKELADKGYAYKCRDKSCNGMDDDGNGYVDDVVGWDFVHEIPLPFDTHGHGTHIAGIIGGGAANGIGSSGVCPNVSLMPLKYYDNSGSGYNNLTNTVRAIEYAVANGAQIINYSGGGSEPAPSEKAAVELARRKGVLFIAAAGNDGRNNDRIPYFPASYASDNIVSVASVNKLSRLLPSSNFGKSVHLAAPGLMILSTLPGGKFGTMSGTSQATAFVSGAAALLASQGEKFDYKRIKNYLLQGAKPLQLSGEKTVISSGLLSLPKSLDSQTAARGTTPGSIAAKQSAKPAPSLQ